MSSAINDTMSSRLPQFDGLRGLASLSVFMSHAILLLPSGTLAAVAAIPPLHLFRDGAAAVDLFFVLSGFVLALPFVGGSNRPIGYAAFVARRIFRILPAYWASLLIALTLRYAFHDADGLDALSSWSQRIWHSPPNFWLDHLILIGRWSTTELINPAIGADRNTNVINPVMWTLIVEMRMSLIFPFAVMLIRRADSALYAILLVLLSLALANLAPVLWALPLFMLGGLIAHYRRAAQEAVSRMPAAVVIGLWIVALALYGMRFLSTGLYPHGFTIHYLSGLGSAVILILALRAATATLLGSAPLRFLGSISYGFYLIHLVILVTISSRVSNLIESATAAWALSCALSLAVSIALSVIVLKFIETPAQRLGRRVSTRLARSKQTSAIHPPRLAPR